MPAQRDQTNHQVLETVHAVLNHVAERTHLLTSRMSEAEAPRQYAAAALVRGCDLIRAGLVTVEAQGPHSEPFIFDLFALLSERYAALELPRTDAELMAECRLLADIVERERMAAKSSASGGTRRDDSLFRQLARLVRP
jgi:hypothetical protein